MFKKYNIKVLDNENIKIDKLNIDILWLWDYEIWGEKNKI